MDYQEFEYAGEWLDICRSKVACTMERADELFGRLVRYVPRAFEPLKVHQSALYAGWSSARSIANGSQT